MDDTNLIAHILGFLDIDQQFSSRLISKSICACIDEKIPIKGINLPMFIRCSKLLDELRYEFILTKRLRQILEFYSCTRQRLLKNSASFDMKNYRDIDVGMYKRAIYTAFINDMIEKKSFDCLEFSCIELFICEICYRIEKFAQYEKDSKIFTVVDGHIHMLGESVDETVTKFMRG